MIQWYVPLWAAAHASSHLSNHSLVFSIIHTIGFCCSALDECIFLSMAVYFSLCAFLVPLGDLRQVSLLRRRGLIEQGGAFLMRYYCCYGKTLLSMSAVSQKARLKLLSTGDYWRRHGLRMRSINHDFKHSQYIFASETQQLALSIDFDGHKCVFCISFLEGPLHAYWILDTKDFRLW